MKVNNNLLLLNNLYVNQRKMQESMYQISSGSKVNSASNDPAGLVIASRIESQLRGLEMGSRNLGDANSYIQTAENAASSAQKVLGRMRELAVQADNGTLNTQDKEVIQKEMDSLKEEYTHITNTASYNGQTVLNQTGTTTVNDGTGQTAVETTNLTSAAGNPVDITTIDVTTPGGAQNAIASIDTALKTVNVARAQNGADMSAVEHRSNFNESQAIVAEAARSRIVDADIAAQVSDMLRSKIQLHANIATLHQSNQNASSILKLLR